jgi:hypothetical protein
MTSLPGSFRGGHGAGAFLAKHPTALVPSG